MRRILYLLAVVLLAMPARKILADVVITNEGDRITGTITSVADGKMVVHSGVVGDVTIPLTHIRTFSTDKPLEFHLADGTVITRQVEQSSPGEVLVSGTGLGAGQPLMVSSIDEVNPKAFSASFQLGGTISRGNTYNDTLNASAAIGYKLKQEDITFKAEYENATEKIHTPTGYQPTTTTEDRWDIEAKYEHFFTKKFYGDVDIDVTKDRIAFLDLRLAPTAGVGYAWLQNDPLHFSTEGGIGWIYENYTNGTPTREEATLRLAYHLNYVFNANISAFHDLVYFPSIEYGSHYLINGDIGLHAKLTKNVFAELKAEWDYDSTPANGALKNDARYAATLGYAI